MGVSFVNCNIRGLFLINRTAEELYPGGYVIKTVAVKDSPAVIAKLLNFVTAAAYETAALALGIPVHKGDVLAAQFYGMNAFSAYGAA